MEVIYIIDLIGTFVFAISGISVAVEKKFDIVGAAILAIVTAIGGGTLRDLLIGKTPVGWMTDINYLIVILAALPISYFFLKWIKNLHKSLFLFDTIGIGLFTIIGIEKTLAVGLHPAIAVMMGIVSAVFGGVIRDVLANEVPLILRKEIYASACLAGGLVYLLVQYLLPDGTYNMIFPIIVVIAIRYFSIRRNWEIPFRPR